ncbi:hypothetical protein AVO46_18710 [Vibrio cholerae]|nr:hypothetical protein AVO46_18710 [Vibrio cholerae]
MGEWLPAGGDLSSLVQGLEGDLVAQGFELSDCAGFCLGGCALREVVGSGVAVEFAGGEQCARPR